MVPHYSGRNHFFCSILTVETVLCDVWCRISLANSSNNYSEAPLVGLSSCDIIRVWWLHSGKHGHCWYIILTPSLSHTNNLNTTYCPPSWTVLQAKELIVKLRELFILSSQARSLRYRNNQAKMVVISSNTKSSLIRIAERMEECHFNLTHLN